MNGCGDTSSRVEDVKWDLSCSGMVIKDLVYLFLPSYFLNPVEITLVLLYWANMINMKT